MPEHEQRPKGGPTGHSRRDFLRGSGLAAASAVLTTTAVEALDEAKAAAAEEGPKVLSGEVSLTLNVNGKDMDCKAEPRSTLLDTLRNRLDVTGPKRVCDRASCGACTVILDGDPVYACTTLAVALSIGTSCTAGLSCHVPSCVSSMTRRHTRARKRATPSTPVMLHGLLAVSGPMNISYRRRLSAP